VSWRGAGLDASVPTVDRRPARATVARGPRRLRRFAGVCCSALVGLVLAFAAGVVLAGAFGYERYVITSGSMTGSYDRGSLVFERPVPVARLRVGDVITYSPPIGGGPTGRVTHRIAWIGRGRDGRPVFRTKGDANPVADPWTFTLDQPLQARAVLGLPYVGYVLAALQERRVRLGLLGVPALAFALASVAALWREAGAAPRRAGGSGQATTETR
jgi:signal peptidase